MIGDFLGINASSSTYIIFVTLLCVAGGLLLYRLKNTIDSVALLAGNRFEQKLILNFSRGRYIAKMILLFLGILFLLLAIMRPRWGKKEEVIHQEGRDLFIALDVSRSMLARDVHPNRLEKAKQKIRSLLKKLDCDRVGLILFSGSTFVQCPLTIDYSSFHMFLDQIDTETISSGTTAIDQAIKRALQSFDEVPARKNKLLVLFTDGEDFSRNLSGIKEQARANGLHIFAVGVGTPEGAPIPLTDVHGNPAGHQRDHEGNVVISKMNEELLRSVAQESGGTYLRAAQDDRDIKRLVKHVHQFEKEALDDKKVSSLKERYHYFLAASFACFVLEWLL